MTSSSYKFSDSDANTYEDGYRAFLNHSNFREEVLREFEKIARTEIKKTQVLRVLDLGCGDGVMTKRYLQILKKQRPLIHLTVLEPAQKSLEVAIKNVRPEVIAVETINTLSADYNYDLIIASYVFYHLPSDTITDVVNLLEPNGSLAIMMGTSDHPLKSHPELQKISNHGSSDKLNPFLKKLAESGEFSISRYPVKTLLSLQGLWDQNTFTDEAKTLLSFSLNQNFENLKDSAISAIRNIFDTAFENKAGNLESIHEIIWIKRIE